MAESSQPARIMELELQLMHLQKDFEALNQMVLENSRRLDDFLSQVTRLNRRLDGLSTDSEPRNLLDEKPPHY